MTRVLVSIAAAIVLCVSRAEASELVIREFEVPKNDPARFTGVVSTAKVDSVAERALELEGLGPLIADSVELRNQIPSERIRTPWKVVQKEPVPRELVGGSAYIAEFHVCHNDSTVYRFASIAIDKPTWTLRSTQTDWVLETSHFRRPEGDGWSAKFENTVVVNGEDLNRKQGYDLCYGFRRIDGVPFYFFERDGRIGWCYDGGESMTDYELVLHDRCCQEIQTNPHFYGNAVTFFAQRGGQWYQVVGMVGKE